MELDANELLQVFQQRFPKEFEICVLTLTVQNLQKAQEPEAKQVIPEED